MAPTMVFAVVHHWDGDAEFSVELFRTIDKAKEAIGQIISAHFYGADEHRDHEERCQVRLTGLEPDQSITLEAGEAQVDLMLLPLPSEGE